MKRFTPFLLLASFALAVLVPLALAATSTATPPRSDRSPGAPVASAISTITGVAISPLLGTSAYGAYRWVAAKDEHARAALPWYAQPTFWLPALLLVGLCAAKDAFGATLPPGWKKPLDVLETIENKFSGLIAAGAVVPFAVDAMTDLLLKGNATAGAPALASSGLAMIHLAAFDVSWLLDVLILPFALAVFAVVWLASHAINVLILLSPWGAIDAALKAARTSLLGLIAVTATMNPWLSAALSLVVIVVAYFVAGWAFRLTVFGTVFSWEFITRRRHRFSPTENNNAMFAGPQLSGVPVRTLGRLVRRESGALEFVYRPWLVRAPRTLAVSATNRELAVGHGVFFSDVVAADGRTLFTLPPRYRGHEEELVRAYALGGGVRPAGLRKAWSALRELVGGRVVAPAVVT
jgi:hypothetical protein